MQLRAFKCGDAHSSKLAGYQFHFFVFRGMLNEACRASSLLFAWDVVGMPVKANGAGWYFHYLVIFDWMAIKASCVGSHFHFFGSIQVCLIRLNVILFRIDVLGMLNIKKIASSHFNCHLGVIWRLVPTALCLLYDYTAVTTQFGAFTFPVLISFSSLLLYDIKF